MQQTLITSCQDSLLFFPIHDIRLQVVLSLIVFLKDPV